MIIINMNIYQVRKVGSTLVHCSCGSWNTWL